MYPVKKWLLIFILTGTGIRISAQTCSLPTPAQWRKTVLAPAGSSIGLDRPSQMAILPDGRVFFAEMWTGKIKLYTPNAGLTEVAALTVYTGTEEGLLGLTVDPNFSATNWLYVFYSRSLPGSAYSAGDANILHHEQVLARFTYAAGKLINQKEILIIPRESKRHASGGMAFNTATGDLFIPAGDDTYPSNDATIFGGRNEITFWLNSLRSSANTNDLRGKVLRIHPLAFPDNQSPAPGIGTTYAIPAGNLFPVGMEKTRPEIYTMGHRNPYKVKIDANTGFGLIGEVGPDANSDNAARGLQGHDEFNLFTGPGNFGWPFAIANNQAYIATDNEAYPKGQKFDLNNLKNLSKLNTGKVDLPPALPALGYYNAAGTQTGPSNAFQAGSETAIAGPLYRYDAGLVSDVKLPPYFHGKFIVGDWSREKIWTMELNSQMTLAKVEQIAISGKVIDLDIGPKGELYVLDYSRSGPYPGGSNQGQLYKLEYIGPQYAASLCPQYAIPTTRLGGIKSHSQADEGRLLNLAVVRQVAAPAGKTLGVLYNLAGTRIWEGPVREGVLVFPLGSREGLGFLKFQ